LGTALSGFIPTEWGLGFAGVLALIGVASSLLTGKLRWLAAVVAGTAAVAAFTLPLRLNILVAIVAAVVACLAVQRAAQQASQVNEGAGS
jgi:predicted branched-subunit amino acid permease